MTETLTPRLEPIRAQVYQRGSGRRSPFKADTDMSPRLLGVATDGGLDHLNIGSGVNPYPGAFNVDIQQFDGVDLMFDFTARWPLDDETWDKVTMFHCLEHVSPHEALGMTKEAFRVLRTGGLCIIEVPDLDGMCREILDGNYGMLIGPLYGGFDAPWDAHRFGYTKASLALLCHLAGFIRLITGPGTDYHSTQMPTIRVEAVKVPTREMRTLADVAKADPA